MDVFGVVTAVLNIGTHVLVLMRQSHYENMLTLSFTVAKTGY